MLRTHSGLQRHAGGVLWDAVHVVGPWEAEVEADGLRALGLAVAMRFEGFFKEPRRITLLLPARIESAQ